MDLIILYNILKIGLCKSLLLKNKNKKYRDKKENNRDKKSEEKR